MDLFESMIAASRPQVKKRAWMNEKVMELVTADTLDRVINACIEAGLYALDLETEGLDNRVFNGRTEHQIVGVCLSPDGVHGYYIPVRHKGEAADHNIPATQYEQAMLRLVNSDAQAIFHNAKFDTEFLQFSGASEPLGTWDNPKKWEDTLILAYLGNSRLKSKGLKQLSKTRLGFEMIELTELFEEAAVKRGELDFSVLDPTWEPVVWYAASDAICTYLLHEELKDDVLAPTTGDGSNQKVVYQIEKLCVPATRWMERARIPIDKDKVAELIQIGNREWFDAVVEVYTEASKLLGRDIRPAQFRILQGEIEGYEHLKFDPSVVVPSFKDRSDEAAAIAEKNRLDPMEAGPNGKPRVETVVKEVAHLTAPGKTEPVSFPKVYDINSAQQLGLLFRELDVPGLTVTENSGQIKTSKDELDRVIDAAGDQFAFMGSIKRFREVQKALSSNLLPLYTDVDPRDNTLRVDFHAYRVDTGRFSTKGRRKGKALHGGTTFNLHSTPSTYDPRRPECLQRIREVFVARPGRKLAAVDYSGVELRIVTNLSKEPKWLAEFFHCSSCDMQFEPGVRPPERCPRCGSDKIGDLHTLTALSIFGEDAKDRPEWKQLRGYGKATNFALCYGGGGTAVVRATGCDKQEGWRIKNQFDKTYTGLAKWWEHQKQFARKYKFVKTALGRWYPLPDIDHEMGGFRAKAERNAINGPIQGCLVGEVRIPTSEGLVPLIDLYAHGEPFMVWTGQGWSEARPLYSGEKQVRITEFSPGTTIKTSPEHLFMTWRDQVDDPQGRGDVLEWVRQKDLVEGDWVAMSTETLEWPEPRYQWASEQVPQEGHLFNAGMTPHNYKGFAIDGNCPELWEFLGLVYGDGSIHPERFTIHVGEPGVEGYVGPSAEQIAQGYADRINAALDVGAYVYHKKRTQAESHKHDIWQVKVCNKAFRDFCRKVLGVKGQNTYTKRVPSALWCESSRNRAAFLRGYFSADGTASSTGDAVSVRSANLNLLRDTHDLLRSLGIRSSYREKSLRVSVLDRERFERMVGFSLPHKQERLVARTKGAWAHQWDTAPPSLVRWVGETVYQSSIYGSLAQPEKAAVHRLKAGSGSRAQCSRYLDRMDQKEVPTVLRELLRYDWERVVSSTDPGETVEMFDVEVFDDLHAFVADGCVVHNTSADLMKLAMALIYKECKRRNWLDKVGMIVTIHDELVFDIDDDILAEAIDTFVRIMEDDTVKRVRLDWQVPLTTDVEIGYNWTVPWDLSEMRNGEVRFIGNKKIKKPEDLEDPSQWDSLPSWPEALRDLFPEAKGEPPVSGSTGGGPCSGSKSNPPKAKVVASTGLLMNSIHVPTLDRGQPFTHKISEKHLTLGLVEKLANVINECKDGGTHPLRIVVRESNESLLADDDEVMINPAQFISLIRFFGV